MPGSSLVSPLKHKVNKIRLTEAIKEHMLIFLREHAHGADIEVGRGVHRLVHELILCNRGQGNDLSVRQCYLFTQGEVSQSPGGLEPIQNWHLQI